MSIGGGRGFGVFGMRRVKIEVQTNEKTLYCMDDV